MIGNKKNKTLTASVAAIAAAIIGALATMAVPYISHHLDGQNTTIPANGTSSLSEITLTSVEDEIIYDSSSESIDESTEKISIFEDTQTISSVSEEVNDLADMNEETKSSTTAEEYSQQIKLVSIEHYGDIMEHFIYENVECFNNGYETIFHENGAPSDENVIIDFQGYGIKFNVPLDGNEQLIKERGMFSIQLFDHEGNIIETNETNEYGLSGTFGIGDNDCIFAFSLTKPLPAGKYRCTFSVYHKLSNDNIYIDFDVF